MPHCLDVGNPEPGDQEPLLLVQKRASVERSIHLLGIWEKLALAVCEPGGSKQLNMTPLLLTRQKHILGAFQFVKKTPLW